MQAQGIDRKPTTHHGAAATKRLREEEERARVAAAGRKQAPRPAAARLDRSAARAQPQRQSRTVASVRAELTTAERELTAQSKAATERIAVIQTERKPAPIGVAVTAELGSVQGWMDDPLGQFLRVWEAQDRAEALRRKLREGGRERPVFRPPTAVEAAELRRSGRERKRLEQFCNRIRQANEQAAALDPGTHISVPEQLLTRSQLAVIEREIARHSTRTRRRRAAREAEQQWELS